jgi:hypothetical protein
MKALLKLAGHASTLSIDLTFIANTVSVLAALHINRSQLCKRLQAVLIDAAVS